MFKNFISTVFRLNVNKINQLLKIKSKIKNKILNKINCFKC